MKKIKFFVLSVVVMLFTACHDKLWDSIEDLDARVTKLEELCKEMNTNISALQTIVSVIQENDFITGIVPIEKGGEVIGYTIMFGKHEPITIYNGVDGKDGQNGTNGVDGKDGYTPILGVAKDTDGVYYWTLDGEWLLDDEGNKIRVTGCDGKDGADGKDGIDGKDGENGKDGADGKDGEDGKDGADGKDGVDGEDGKDGVTPQLKIEEGYWYISYDNGATWTELGKAVGEDGKDGTNGTDGKDGQDGKPGADGKDGQNGDSMFTSVTYDDNNVYFTLTDGSVLIVPRGKDGGVGENDPSDIIKFEDLNVKLALLKRNIDINKDGEISYEEATSFTNKLNMNGTAILSFKEFKYFTGVTSFSFENCTNLFEIILPNTLDVITNASFRGCSKLLNIIIPESCKLIDDYAFSNCENLNNILLLEGSQRLTIGECAFYNCKKLNNVVIPSTCDSIKNEAFYNCVSLSELEIKEGCEYIGTKAFENCILTNVILPNSIQYLGLWSFECATLTSFVFSEKLNCIELPYGCYQNNLQYDDLTSVTWNTENYNGSLVYSGSDYIGSHSVYGIAALVQRSSTILRAANLAEVIIGENVIKIPGNFCYYANKITTITIPRNVLEIGNYAFYGCSSLYMVYSKNPVPPTLGSDVFSGTKIGIIYVPTASVNVYKAAWSDYADKIVGYDF